jgi:hypothetical protein
MTNIIKKIFVDAANRTEKSIKDNAKNIAEQCQAFSDIVAASTGGDELRGNLSENGFAWLYDTLGKPNKSGKAKAIMSGHMKMLKGGMIYIHENEAAFLTWCDSKEKTGVSSIRGIKAAISPKKEKAEKVTSSDENSDNEGDSTETETQGDNRSRAELLENFLQIWTNAKNGGDAQDLIDYITDSEAAKICDGYLQHKAA